MTAKCLENGRHKELAEFANASVRKTEAAGASIVEKVLWNRSHEKLEIVFILG